MEEVVKLTSVLVTSSGNTISAFSDNPTSRTFMTIYIKV